MAEHTNNADLRVTVELHAMAGASRSQRVAGRRATETGEMGIP